MKKLRITLIACASLLIVSILVFKGFGGQPAHAAPTTCGSWSIVPSANVSSQSSDELFGVATTSTNDAWAVGDSASQANALTEHWNGSQWDIIPSPDDAKSGSDTLHAVAELSANNVWAVGSYYVVKSASTFTLVEHWDGSKWHIVASPNANSNSNNLAAVVAIAHNNVWAVGSYINSSHFSQTLIEHWNGTKWSIVSSPSTGTDGSILSGVTAISSSDIWAVGYTYGSAVQDATLTEHWNGSQWSIVSSPNVGTHGSVLSSVTAVSSSDVWAVGESNIEPHQVNQTLIEQWNGTGWSVVASPNVGVYSNTLQGVTAVSANTIWAVGTYVKNNHERWQALIEEWNGTSWSVVASPQTIHNGFNYLNAVAAIPGTSQVWGVGIHISTTAHQYQTLTEFYC